MAAQKTACSRSRHLLAKRKARTEDEITTKACDPSDGVGYIG